MELERKLAAFEKLGVGVIAITTNPGDLAERAYSEWGLKNLTVGHGLSIAGARRWGLFVSRAIKDTEPAEFSEPGIFVVRPDGTLYASIVQTMPFSRPSAEQLLSTLEWVIQNDYPARGAAAVG